MRATVAPGSVAIAFFQQVISPSVAVATPDVPPPERFATSSPRAGRNAVEGLREVQEQEILRDSCGGDDDVEPRACAGNRRDGTGAACPEHGRVDGVWHGQLAVVEPEARATRSGRRARLST